MNQTGRNDIVPLIVITMIVILAAVIFLFYNIGQSEKTKVEIEKLDEKYCSQELDQFYTEYSLGNKSKALFLNRRNFYIITFPGGWIVPVDSQDCRIVEEKDRAILRFQIWDYDKLLDDVNANFYEATQDCLQISVAKGGSKACDIVTPINQMIDAPITNVIATVPTEASQAMVAAFVKEGWKEETKSLAGNVVKVVKTVKGSGTVLAALEIVERTGCPFKDTPQKAIFDLADEGNQILLRSKSDQYSTDSIAKLDAINAYIITLNSIDMNQSGDIVGAVLGGAVDFFGSNLNPNCAKDKQAAKFNWYQEKFEGNKERAIKLSDTFQNQLNKLKNQAEIAMGLEDTAKRMYSPKDWQLFFISKNISYTLEPSTTRLLYNQQRYVSSKEALDARIDFYKRYWDEVTLADWLFSIAIWMLIVLPPTVLLFLLLKWLTYRD